MDEDHPTSVFEMRCEACGATWDPDYPETAPACWKQIGHEHHLWIDGKRARHPHQAAS